MKNVLKSLVKTAVLAAAVLPYSVEKDENGCKVDAFLYSVSCDLSEEGKKKYTISLLPTVNDQVELVKKAFSDCKEKWNDPEDEQANLIREKISLVKEKLDEFRSRFGSDETAFDEEETVDESDFSEDEFSAGFEEEAASEDSASDETVSE